jgi:uncharacterized membrane protein YesL
MKEDKNTKFRVFLGDIFRPEGTVVNVLDVFSDTIIVNILFLLTCIPIVTAGAAVTALWKESVRIRKGEGSGVFRCYFSDFKQAFRKSTPVGLFLNAILLIIGLEYPITRVMPDEMGNVFRGVLTVLFLLWIVEMIYVFPIMNQFSGSRLRCMGRALTAAFWNLPKTAIMIAVTLFPLVLMWLIPESYKLVIMFMLLFGAAGIAQLNSIFFEKMVFPQKNL